MTETDLPLAMSWITVECPGGHPVTVVTGDQSAVVVEQPDTVVEMWRLNTTLVLPCTTPLGEDEHCGREVQVRLGGSGDQLGWHSHWFPGKPINSETIDSFTCRTCFAPQCEPEGMPSLVELWADAVPIEYHQPGMLRLKDGEVIEWSPVNE